MQNNLNRLRFQCRRGMLELDIFLQRYLEEAYLQLSPEDQELFEVLLSCQDQDLFIWLTEREQPTDPALARMVKMIRQHVNPLSRD